MSTEGDENANNITGTTGDDTINANGGNDTVNSGDGSDSVTGGAGDDAINAGSGNNTVRGGSGADSITAEAGDDSVDGGDDNDTIQAGSGQNTVSGGGGDDSISTFGGNDSIDGGAGADSIEAGQGSNAVDGGADNDTITSFDGNDSVAGGAGDDSINAGNGDNTVSGGDGHDTITTYDGADNIDGGDGNDRIETFNGNDTVQGGAGDDTIDGGLGDDTIFGGDGNDSITGGGGQDVIVGGRGNDTLTAGNNSTTDTFVIRDGDGSDVITDFDPFEPDVIAFNMEEIQSFQDFQDRLSQDGPDTVITYDNGDTTRLLNVDMNNLSASNFSTQAGPVCLHAGTQVATPLGPRLVEDLLPGDPILTDTRLVAPIVAVCAQRLHFTGRKDPAKPVLIGQGTLGPDLPRRDLIVSPQHRIAVVTEEGSRALLPAKRLCRRRGIRQMYGRKRARYHNILLDRHALIEAEGLSVETALLTDFSRSFFGPAADGIGEMTPALPILDSDPGPVASLQRI